MKLKLYIIDQLAGILAGVKINKMEDKDAKAALLKNYLALRKGSKEAASDRDEIVRKFQEDWKEELPAVEAYRREHKPVVGHLDYLDAEKDANKEISDLFNTEIELALVPVAFDAFAGVSDDITLEQVAFLQENGIIY